MNRCDQARRLFSAFWDDEVTQAEREWLDAHFTSCAGCRAEYDQFARTLEVVGGLPRVDVSADMPERALAAARRAGAVPDRLAVAPPTPRWVPVTAAAALLVVMAALLLPTVLPLLDQRGSGLQASRPGTTEVAEPRLVATVVADPAATKPAVTLADSLFDHSEDVEFILDPVVLHRGRAQSPARLPAGMQGEQTVISF